MALINPSNLYSGGNVVLDAMPYVRMAMAARERKAAREEAVDKYYQNLPNTINDKGVRDQEVPIISDIKNQMMETYLKNREAIKRGDPVAQLELSKLTRQGLSVARNSQNASANDIKVGVMAQKKENLPILTSPYFIEKHQKSLLPVTDPNYEPLNMADILAQRPFDENEYRKSIKSNYKYSEGVPIVAPHPTDKSLNVVTTNPILDKPTKEQMYADAAEQYHSNPTFEKKIHDLGANPETLNRLNEVSKATFGKEIEEPEDIAAAYTASLLPSMTTKAVVKPSAEYANAEKEKQKQRDYARSLQKMGYNDQFIRGRMKLGDEYKKTYAKFKSAMDAGEENKILDTFIDTMVKTGTPTPYTTHKGQIFKNGTTAQLPKELADKYVIWSKDDKGEDVREIPKAIFISKDKQTVVPLYYNERVNGKAILSPEKSVPNTMQNFKLDLSKLLLTKKQTGAEVTDKFASDENPSIMQSTETGTIEKHPVKKETPKKDPLGIF